jgi:hypothetical protein
MPAKRPTIAARHRLSMSSVVEEQHVFYEKTRRIGGRFG